MFYAMAIHFSVPVPKKAALFLRDTFDFKCFYQDDESWLAKNDAITLVLHTGKPSSVALQLHSTDMAVDSSYLSKLPHVYAMDASIQQQGALCWQHFNTDCGLQLCLCRTLNEDELAVLPPLPKNLPWDEQVDSLVRHVLRIVPVDFRNKARARITERAEFLCLGEGDLLVTEGVAIQALKDATLDFQQRELYETLQEQGIDVDRYFIDGYGQT
ncbi:MAG: hypothetical protein Q9M22_02435 [Mariprofundaceae bacterium]|nr:hypothetical protein [Mariprofundaceae bacterium]